MKLRRWQQEIIDGFPDIQKAHRRFIIKAPTGAGKTVLASEIIRQFYAGKRSLSFAIAWFCWNSWNGHWHASIRSAS